MLQIREQVQSKRWLERLGFSHQLMIYLQASLVGASVPIELLTQNNLQDGHFTSVSLTIEWENNRRGKQVEKTDWQ